MAAHANLRRVSVAGEAVVFLEEIVDVLEAVAGTDVSRLVVLVVGALVEVLGVDYYGAIVSADTWQKSR
jgi:hypothetical protein